MTRDGDWNRPESEITPPDAFEHRPRDQRPLFTRRGFLKRVAAYGALAGGAVIGCRYLSPAAYELADDPYMKTAPGRDLYPAPVHPDLGEAPRVLTPESTAASYNNFYEFGLRKERVHVEVRDHPFTPWTVEVAGLVARPRVFDIDDLIREMPLDERIYRFRCVEAWAMTVPWTGFPISALLERVEPLPAADHIRFVSLHDPDRMPGQRGSSFPWPYREALTLEEAANPLAFLATGIYGHPLPRQHGAPLRLVVPWKYGFKSAKSIVRIELVQGRPQTFWSDASSEYGFWANVNPGVPHPRWSQASEELIGSGDRVPTQLWNGYGEWVADLYADMDERPIFY